MSHKQITAIDLFAGAGGFSLSAHEAGLKVLAAVEIDKDACETYAHNIVRRLSKQTKLYSTDILEKLTPQFFRTDLGLEPGELDLLLGGPPCQGFSSHRINGAGIDDPRNKLLLRYFEYVEELRPKAFLVENVSGLLWKRHEQYLNKFKALANSNGYKLLGPHVLNARDYGVPQNRRRVFMLGIDNSLNLPEIAWPPEPTHGPNANDNWLTASTVFEKPPTHKLIELSEKIGAETVSQLSFGGPLNKDDPCNVHTQHTEKLINVFNSTPINGSREDSGWCLPCHSNGYKGHKDVYGRIRLALPSNTITTGCHNPTKGRFVHPWLNHGITIRHAARLQTFPDNFVFKGTFTNQGKQVGNAVPARLGKILISNIKQNLLT